MKQQDKELLLVDLCARLPYHPVIKWINLVNGSSINEELGDLSEINLFFISQSKNNEAKPYLRPMSSMTEEEKLYLELNYRFEFHGDVLSNLHIIKGGGYYEREGEYVEPTEYRQYSHITIDTVSELIKWLNAHHFDYRGLIEKGLALEAPEGMYKIK